MRLFPRPPFDQSVLLTIQFRQSLRRNLIDNSNIVGKATSETKLSQDASYQNGMDIYGGNNPIIYTSLMATVSQQPALSNLDVKTEQTRISVQDSSGSFLDFSRVGDIGMLDSPHDSSSQTVDWLNLLVDLYNFLAVTNGLPASPNLPNGLTATGWGSDSTSFWAKWCTADLFGGCGVLVTYTTDKAISFRYQLNFPKPDVYTISISTYVELGVGIGLLTSCCTVGWSYSFKYVYESDANSGNDAGNSFSTATGISLGGYSGLLYGADTVDMYKFDATQGQTIYYNLIPPPSADFGVAFYDPSWNLISGAGGDPGTGHTLYGWFTPSSTGSYYEKIYLTSGTGTYSFALSPSPIPPDFSIFTSPSYYCLTPGYQARFSATVKSINGFSSPVTLSETISPSNPEVWGSFGNPPGNPVTLSVPAGGSTIAGFYAQAAGDIYLHGDFTIMITATSGLLRHVASSALHVDYFAGCPGPSGGSVASGTLITLADYSQIPVQNLKVGDQLLSYDMTSGQYVNITLTRFVTVQTDNLMIIHTAKGKPLITDQNPAQKLEVMFPNGTWTELSVTELKVGDYLFDASAQAWVLVTRIDYLNGGVHTMYDIYTNAPTLNYIANNYLDYIKV